MLCREAGGEALAPGLWPPLSSWTCSTLCSRAQLACPCKRPRLSRKNAFRGLVSRARRSHAGRAGGTHGGGEREAGGTLSPCAARLLPCELVPRCAKSRGTGSGTGKPSLPRRLYQDIAGPMQGRSLCGLWI